MRHEERPGAKLVIPIHSRPVTPGTLSNILKKAEISIDELRELL
jgi:predicted RNA binding protein YcfA (HicA-like mRNA interferase family)